VANFRTNAKNVLLELSGNGVSEVIYGRGGRDVLRAGRYSRDTDRLYGNRGQDRLLVLDGDARDKASGGPGRDTLTRHPDATPALSTLLVRSVQAAK
jgi:Ca2+-binding RTX toxin-like protein